MIRKNICYTLTVLFMLLNFSGCTIIGFVAGSIIDAHNAVIQSPDLEKLQKIKHDTPLTIYLDDQKIMKGKFQGVATRDSAEYWQRYTSFYSAPQYTQFFPAMNDTLTLLIKSIQRTRDRIVTRIDQSHYRFSGFDFNSIRLQSLPDNQLRVEELDNLIMLIDRQGMKMNPQTIRGYVTGGMVPLRSELDIQVDNEMLRIGGEKVLKVKLPKSAGNRIVGSLVGLVVDIAVLSVIGQSNSYSPNLSGK